MFSPSSRVLNLSISTLLVMALCWPNTVKADSTLSFRLINRSTTKTKLHVWDENQSHKEIFNKEMAGNAELPFTAVAKSPTNPRSNAPGIHVLWKIEALDDRGFPLKPGEKGPVRCGGFTTPKDNQRFDVGPYKNVPGADC